MNPNSTIWNKGATQQQRWQQSVLNADFQIDERSFDALVKEIDDYAKKVIYTRLEDVREGNKPKTSWSPFIEIDEIVILAQLKYFNIRAIEDRFYYNLHHSTKNRNQKKKYYHFQEAISVVKGITDKFWKWHTILKKISSEGRHFAIFQEWDLALKPILHPSHNVFQRAENVVENNSPITKRELDQLDQFFKKVVKTAFYLMSKYDQFLELAKSHQHHLPHNGLIFSFLELFALAQELLNTFHQRHLDYYYKNQLKLQPKGSVSDKVILQFDLAENRNQYLLPEDTKFSAGEDEDGKEIIYSTTEDLIIGKYQVQELKGVSILKDRNIKETSNRPVDEILSANYPLDTKSAWPVLDLSNSYSESFVHSADIGFAIESPNFHLTEGVRQISLEFEEEAEVQFLAVRPEIKKSNPTINEIDFKEILKELEEKKKKLELRRKELEPRKTESKVIKKKIALIEEALVLNEEELELLKEVLSDEDYKEQITLANFIKIVYKPSISEEPLTDDFVKQVLSINGGEWSTKKLSSLYDDTFKPSSSVQEFINFLERETNIDKSKSSIVNTMSFMLRETHEETDNYGSKKSKTKDISHGNLTLERKFRRLFIDAFQIYYSCDKGWEKIIPTAVEFRDKKIIATKEEQINEDGEEVKKNKKIGILKYKVVFYLYIDQDKQPFVSNVKNQFTYPTLKFLVNPNASVYPYDFLNQISCQKISCAIEVTNLRELLLYNQIGQINSDSPFLPFGPSPNLYSYFLVGNKEVFRKNYDEIILNIRWMDFPREADGFTSYYRKYGFPVENGSFKYQPSILASGKWIPKEEHRKTDVLFTGKGFINSDKKIIISSDPMRIGANSDWDPKEFDYSKKTDRGFIKLQLVAPSWSFGHDLYPNLLSRLAIQNAKKLTGITSLFLKKDFKMELINAPYTPKIEAISMDYKLRFSMDFRRKNTSKNSLEKLHHLHPFGGKSEIEVIDQAVKIVPSFSFEGALYIGLDNFMAPGIISLFFNLKEREVDQDHDSSSSIDWYYLKGNTWVLLKPWQIPLDTTGGLIHSGIIKLDVPSYQSDETTLLNPHLFWVSVTAKRNTDLLGKVVSIKTNAVEARFLSDIEIKRSSFSLKQNSIVGPLTAIPAINEVNQPLASFGGVEPETDRQFKRRISERLRHKQRCVEVYDYERIILEAFPEINKVLCINAYDWKENKRKSGKVLIVPVPMINLKSTFNRRYPRNSVKVLREVEKMIESLCSPFVDVNVINPTYEMMRVFAKVKIKKDLSTGHYIQTLNQELMYYISPWLKDANEEPQFQRKIAKAAIQSFIQSREYVDFVTKVSMVKVDRALDPVGSMGHHLRDSRVNHVKDNEIRGFYPWSIITTAKQHHLDIIDSTDLLPPDHVGLEELYVDEDFIIVPKPEEKDEKR
ncbi:MAG: baseplate J/gp47 family protein [Bacteroidota bacterium]